MEAQSKKSRGLNINPLAPAQSKRTFAFSKKNRNPIGNASILAPFFSLFVAPFCKVFQESRKGVQGPAPDL